MSANRKPHTLVLIRWNDGTVSQSVLMDKPIAERHARHMRNLPAVSRADVLGLREAARIRAYEETRS